MIDGIKKLKSFRSRRIFGTFCILFLGFLALTLTLTVHFRQALSSALYDVVYSVQIELIAATIAAALIFAIVLALFEEEAKLEDIMVCDPRRTKVLHDEALVSTDRWNHNGHLGRWVRTTAMPALAKTSVERGVSTKIRLCILNPVNIDLCMKYVAYRNRITFKEPVVTSLIDVQLEILATIVAAKLHHAGPSGLSVEVFLKDFMSLVREDSTSKFVFRTYINPRCSAVVFVNGNGQCEQFNTAITDFEYTTSLARRLNLDTLEATGGAGGGVSTDYVKGLLEAVDCLVRDDKPFLEAVVDRLGSSYHPYT